jgi:hypothetical protein
MTYDDLQAAWNSPHNRPSPDELDRQKQQLQQRLRRQHRGFVVLTGLASCWLLGTAAMFTRHIATGGAFDGSREWGALVVFILPLLALAQLWRRFLAHRAAHATCDRSIRSSVAALLDENRLARFRTRLIAALNGLMLLVIPVVVFQLRAVGKAGDEILVPAFVLFPALMIAVLGGMLFHYRRTLLPEKAELETLLRSYE